ncbi:MAG: hypothetical protein Q7S12_02415 [bacterium]|nr:hypothetical protein [bacterium]
MKENELNNSEEKIEPEKASSLPEFAKGYFASHNMTNMQSVSSELRKLGLNELASEVSDCSVSMVAARLLETAKTITSSYEAGSALPKQGDDRVRFMGEYCFSSLIGHSVPYVMTEPDLYAKERGQKDLTAAHKLFKELRESYNWERSAEEIYKLCLTTIDSLESAELVQDSEAEYFKLAKQLGCTTEAVEKGMMAQIKEALRVNAIPRIALSEAFFIQVKYISEKAVEELTEQEKKIFTVILSFREKEFTSFKDFVEAARKLDDMLNKISFSEAEKSFQYGSNLELKLTLRRSDIVGLVQGVDDK